MERPLRVLVVDDEQPIRVWLRHMEWPSFDAEWIGEAENGEEAMDFCSNHIPDVAIVDITMPIMGGMELIEQLSGKFPEIKVILLTCHDEFDYARKALNLGAVDYLLKAGLSEEDLRSALGKARQALAKDVTHEAERRREERKARSELFREACKLGETTGKLPSIVGENHVNGGLALSLILLGEQEDLYFADRLFHSILDELEGRYDFTWFPASLGEYILLSHHNVSYLSWLEQMNRLFAEVKQHMQSSMKTPSSEIHLLAYTSPFKNDGGLISLYHRRESWKVSYFYEEGSFFNGKPPEIGSWNIADIEDLKKACYLSDGDELLQALQNVVLPAARKHRIHPVELRSLLLELLIPRQQVNRQEIERRIQHASTGSELMAQLVYVIEGAKPSTGRSEIVWVKNYVVQHMSEPITLSDVAGKVGFNPQYLGKLFQEETGESFKSFLTRVRMEKAMELIWNTNKKIYVIAEEIGIANYPYFTALFRKWTGVSPTEYKKR